MFEVNDEDQYIKWKNVYENINISLWLAKKYIQIFKCYENNFILVSVFTYSEKAFIITLHLMQNYEKYTIDYFSVLSVPK